MNIVCVTMDCADVRAVAAFWRDALGCSAGDLAGLDAEIARLVALGATVAWEEEFPTGIAARYRNVILRDVEGNELCLSGGSWSG